MVSVFAAYSSTEVVTFSYTEVATTKNMVTHDNNTKNQDQPTVAGEWFPTDVRNCLMWVVFGIGLLGNSLVMLKLWINRRRKSRVNTIVLGIASADMAVCIFAMLPSSLIEMYPEWRAGNATCKIVMFLQGSALISTGNMVMILALDRHHAVRSPLKEFFTAWKLVAAGWVVAFTLAVPQLAVWQTYHSRSLNITRCGTMLRSEDKGTQKMLYLTYIAIITFFIPLVVMSVAYIRIFKKIHDKAQETSGKKRTKKGKIQVNQTGGSGVLSKAKKKTLMMSIVIIGTFIVCSVPFFVVEMIRIYMDKTFMLKISNVYAVFSIMAVANSATNPYVFLLFNITRGFLVELQGAFCPCCPKAEQNEYSRYSVKFSTSSNSRHNHTNKVCNNDHVTRITDVQKSPNLKVKKTEES
ncbi:cardioacceleratory peptide receptor-like [Amphiura filiformis]|uniref:cardioacceleratory peptide receptor-like n=1 Tax=Amphiura filiformis TaxID=82378 RepID=UPI003B226EE2